MGLLSMIKEGVFHPMVGQMWGLALKAEVCSFGGMGWDGMDEGEVGGFT